MTKRLKRTEIEDKLKEMADIIDPLLEACGLGFGLMVFDSERPDRVAYASSIDPAETAWLLRDLLGRIEQLKPTTGSA